MGRNFELDIFGVLQRRQRLFIKVAILSLSVSAAFFLLSAAFRWPLFLALIPMALTGPDERNFMMPTLGARDPSACPVSSHSSRRQLICSMVDLRNLPRISFLWSGTKCGFRMGLRTGKPARSPARTPRRFPVPTDALGAILVFSPRRDRVCSPQPFREEVGHFEEQLSARPGQPTVLI